MGSANIKIFLFLFLLFLFLSQLSYALNNDTYESSQINFVIDFGELQKQQDNERVFSSLKEGLLRGVVFQKRSRFIINFVDSIRRKYTSDRDVLLTFEIRDFKPNKTDLTNFSGQLSYKLFDVFWFSPAVKYYYEYDGIIDSATVSGFNIRLGVTGKAFVEGKGHFDINAYYTYPARFYTNKTPEHAVVYTNMIRDEAYLVFFGRENTTINYYLMLPNGSELPFLTNVNGNVNIGGSAFEIIIPKFLFPFDKYKLRFDLCTPYKAFANIRPKEHANFEVILDNKIWKDWRVIGTNQCGDAEFVTLTLKRRNLSLFIISIIVPLLSLVALVWDENFKSRLITYVTTFLTITLLTFPTKDISQLYPLRIFLLLTNLIVILIVENRINKFSNKLGNIDIGKLNYHLNLLCLLLIIIYSFNLVYLIFKEEYTPMVFNIIGLIILFPSIKFKKTITSPTLFRNPINRLLIFIIYIIVIRIFLTLVFLKSNYFIFF